MLSKAERPPGGPRCSAAVLFRFLQKDVQQYSKGELLVMLKFIKLRTL